MPARRIVASPGWGPLAHGHGGRSGSSWWRPSCAASSGSSCFRRGRVRTRARTTPTSSGSPSSTRSRRSIAGTPNRFSDAISQSTLSTDYIGLLTREQLRFLRRDITVFPREPDNLSARSSGTLLTGGYPPGYYLLGAVAYQVPGLHTATARLYAIRIVSALLGGLAALLIFRLLLAAGVPELLSLLGTVAFVQLPMFTQSSAIVNPDILLSVTLAGLAASLLRARVDPTRRRLCSPRCGCCSRRSRNRSGVLPPSSWLIALFGIRPLGHARGGAGSASARHWSEPSRSRTSPRPSSGTSACAGRTRRSRWCASRSRTSGSSTCRDCPS